ncbi:hypothetical protein [Salibacterium qingdaonense]|uniref:Uncharacterized protein n=1 Tax=Salibacterium qingdaonense TaxID=266892 RepID=A0A1I4KJP2_9BACI|nr:hypothetical protein [Salibacterium qingdaonense]SFL79010.1 hypothetical protein SAMN04488054_10558 [Salibacterium qingdaonense]
MSYREYWNQIQEKKNELNSLISSYWSDHSNVGTWEFWVVVSLLVLPLLLLYFIDRTRIFELFCFGYTVHLLWTYIDLILENHNYLSHTYFLTPLLPFAVTVTTSLLPVGFLLMYQYCTNHKKNYYICTFVLSAVFVFVFMSVERVAGLVEFDHGMTQFYVFLIDIVIAYISYWFITGIKRFIAPDAENG